MKLLKNRESGQALVMALILLALGGLLLAPLLNLSTTSLKYHQVIEGKTLESYSADSGVQYALCELYNSPGAYAQDPFEKSFTINNRTVNVIGEYVGDGVYTITSTATSDSGRSTTVRCYINLSVGIFAFAIAGKDSIRLENVRVDSSPDPGEGNLHSNGNIDLVGGNVLVNGDASAVGTISGQESVTGVIEEYSSAAVFPQDYAILYEVMAKEGGTYTGDLEFKAGKIKGTVVDTFYLGPLYIDGNLSVKPDTYVILEGVVYVTGTILVEGGHIEGEENLLAEGDIIIHGGGYGCEAIPIVTSIYGNITLQGPLVDAVLYAPDGTVSFSNIHLYGGVGGKTVTVTNSIITYAKQLHGRKDIPGGELHTIAYSFR